MTPRRPLFEKPSVVSLDSGGCMLKCRTSWVACRWTVLPLTTVFVRHLGLWRRLKITPLYVVKLTISFLVRWLLGTPLTLVWWCRCVLVFVSGSVVFPSAVCFVICVLGLGQLLRTRTSRSRLPLSIFVTFRTLFVCMARLTLCSCLMLLVLITCRFVSLSMGVLGWVGVPLICSSIPCLITSLVSVLGAALVAGMAVITLFCCTMSMVLATRTTLCSPRATRTMAVFRLCRLCRTWNRRLVLGGASMLAGLLRTRTLVC